MKTYAYLWRLIAYRPVILVCDVFVCVLVSLAPILPGLIIQQFFNRLPQVGHLTPELWLLAALPVAIALARGVLDLTIRTIRGDAASVAWADIVFCIVV
jgi:ATP-binding cassette, subfamily B, bacterial